MDLRKAALITTWLCFWPASLVLLFYNMEEETSSISIFVIILNICKILLEPVIFFILLDPYISLKPCFIGFRFFVLDIQPVPVLFCFFAILWIIEICAVCSVKIGIWLMIVSNLIKFIPQLILINQTYALRPTQVPRLSQPRHNLLANEPPTTLTPNFEDVEQPPPSYEEYLALGNDLPPKYEDLEEAPPAYQETML